MASLRRSPNAPENRYTQIPNEWARHETMGLAARAVLTWMLSHKDGWTMSRASIVAQNAWLTDFQARKALDELEALQILYREEEQQRDGGKFGAAVWHLIYPGDPYPTVGWLPTDGTPPAAEPPAVSQPLKEDQSQEDQSKNTPTPPPGSEVAVSGVEKTMEEFEILWRMWPNKNDKKDARLKYARVKKTQPFEKLLPIVTAWSLAYDQWPKDDLRFVPAFVVWLNKERWENPVPEARPTGQLKETNAERMIREYRERNEREQGPDQRAVDRG